VPTHLHLDAFAGLAGDMFLGALVDLGAGLDTIAGALAPLDLQPRPRLTAEPTSRHGIRGIDLKVHTDGDHPHAPHHHHHVTPGDILAMIDRLDLAPRPADRARRIVTILAEAEARVHGTTLDKVHFHEVGAVDSIVDMLGAAIALELLDVDTVSAAAVPIGSGFVECAHGTMPLPAPATAAILAEHRIPQRGVDWTQETVTPTGAAILTAVAGGYGHLPAMSVCRIGYGAGDRDDPHVPNLLRAYLGERLA
jgi:uncharacterized protein (TIGR00299 family) protein